MFLFVYAKREIQDGILAYVCLYAFFFELCQSKTKTNFKSYKLRKKLNNGFIHVYVWLNIMKISFEYDVIFFF